MTTARSEDRVCCQVVQAIAIVLAVTGTVFSIVFDINSDPNYAASAHGILGFVLVALVVVCLCWLCIVQVCMMQARVCLHRVCCRCLACCRLCLRPPSPCTGCLDRCVAWCVHVTKHMLIQLHCLSLL